MTPPVLSTELQDWARRAGMDISADSGAAIIYSLGGEIRYYIRAESAGWFLLNVASRGGDESFRLRGASLDVIERYLFDVFGTVIRDELRLHFLMKPFGAADVAPGYELSWMSDDGYRTLSAIGVGPIAQARDETRSLLTLVPLSHLLRLTSLEVQQTYLTESGAPLMSGEQYMC